MQRGTEVDSLTYTLDGVTLHELKEIDSLNRDA